MVRVVEEVTVPANDGATVIVKRNQVLRVKDTEGGQVGDMVVINNSDFREKFSGWASQQIQGNLCKIKILYSNPPFLRPMMSIENDTVPGHWPGASRCNRVWLDTIGRKEQKASCQDILEKTLSPFGIQSHEVPDVFNVFMKMNILPDGRREIAYDETGKTGDYTDFRAHFDCLIGMSACPTICGKTLLMQILSP